MSKGAVSGRVYPLTKKQERELQADVRKTRKWIDQLSLRFKPELAGKITLMNVETGEYVFAAEHDEATALFKEKFGDKIMPFLFFS